MSGIEIHDRIGLFFSSGACQLSVPSETRGSPNIFEQRADILFSMGDLKWDLNVKDTGDAWAAQIGSLRFAGVRGVCDDRLFLKGDLKSVRHPSHQLIDQSRNCGH